MNQVKGFGLNRRQLLQAAGCGFGGVALHSMVTGLAAGASSQPLAVRAPLLTPRAKRVIFLFMGGGPSQMDLFDPKPLITKNHGKTVEAAPELQR